MKNSKWCVFRTSSSIHKKISGAAERDCWKGVDIKMCLGMCIRFLFVQPELCQRAA